MLEALGTWSVLETGYYIVDWKVGLSQDLAATSNSKNTFISFICLVCLGCCSPQDLAATSNSKNAFISFICLVCFGRCSPCATTIFLVEEIDIC